MSLKNKKQVDGKLRENNNPTTLEQIWGSSGISKYGTMDESEYKNQLEEMPFTDLRAHAVKHMVTPSPIDNKDRLKEKLIKEFRKYVGSFNKPHPISKSNSKPISDKVLKILAEGK